MSIIKISCYVVVFDQIVFGFYGQQQRGDDKINKVQNNARLCTIWKISLMFVCCMKVQNNVGLCTI
jgi:hypothetical protein